MVTRGHAASTVFPCLKVWDVLVNFLRRAGFRLFVLCKKVSDPADGSAVQGEAASVIRQEVPDWSEAQRAEPD